MASSVGVDSFAPSYRLFCGYVNEIISTKTTIVSHYVCIPRSSKMTIQSRNDRLKINNNNFYLDKSHHWLTCRWVSYDTFPHFRVWRNSFRFRPKIVVQWQKWGQTPSGARPVLITSPIGLNSILSGHSGLSDRWGITEMHSDLCHWIVWSPSIYISGSTIGTIPFIWQMEA